MLDPIELQVLSGALRAGCEEMGVVLIRSAHSSNIKERRDASTGLFDADGQMVMQAEHIPVHLGAMGAAVGRCSGSATRRASPGSSTTPSPAGRTCPTSPSSPGVHPAGELVGFAASRAHHADVGARPPGSMPADSRTLEEEGVVISPGRWTSGRSRSWSRGCASPPSAGRTCGPSWPRTAPARAGWASSLERLGPERLREGTDAVLDYSERRTRACLAELPTALRTGEDFLEAPEGDLVLRLRAELRGERLMLDFAGSAPQHAGNLNCPLAVTDSACLFAVRVLTDPDIPATRRGAAAARGDRPARAACSTPGRARPWRRATSRRPRASPTSS